MNQGFIYFAVRGRGRFSSLDASWTHLVCDGTLIDGGFSRHAFSVRFHNLVSEF